MFRISMLVASLAAALALTAATSKADEYPSKPITIIVPYSAGGGADVIVRVAADALEKEFKQRVIVENVTGAGGTIGVRRAAHAAPDGYTLVTVSPGTHAAAPALYKDLGYDPLKDYEKAGLTGTTPIVLVTRKGLPVKNLKEFAEYLKANEKKVTLAHVGPGSMTHLSCSMFDSIVGVNPTAAAYRGTPPLMQDLLGGRVDYTCQQPNGIIGLVNKGDIIALAVADDHREVSLPNVPDADEAGFPGFKATAWNGLVMPKGTPDAVVNKFNKALAKVLSDPAVVKQYANIGVTVRPPEQRTREFQRKFMEQEYVRYTTLMKKIGIKPQ
jgi:tripartite-type tricarboxylate transporter receptor subunit TctC